MAATGLELETPATAGMLAGLAAAVAAVAAVYMDNTSPTAAGHSIGRRRTHPTRRISMAMEAEAAMWSTAAVAVVGRMNGMPVGGAAGWGSWAAGRVVTADMADAQERAVQHALQRHSRGSARTDRPRRHATAVDWRRTRSCGRRRLRRGSADAEVREAVMGCCCQRQQQRRAEAAVGRCPLVAVAVVVRLLELVVWAPPMQQWKC